jgi:TetR/AcrR family transcriptional regulator, tetracycline repressor protein
MKPGPRRSISQTDIVDAAFEILEQKGFAAVSIRGVAAALGLTPTAMYTYFPSKNALLRAMVEQVLGRPDLEQVGTATDADPRARVLALAGALRELIVGRPGGVGLLLAAPLDGPNATRIDEQLLAAFTDAGLDLAAAGRAAHAVRVHVLGAVAFDAAEAGWVSDPATAPEHVPAAASHPLWDDLESFPLSEAGRALADDPAERFAWGIERLLDGLLAVAPAPRR